MLNVLYEGDSSPPAEGSEDYTVWTALLNAAINIWENEEGMLWKELFVKLADAPDGTKTTTAGTFTYTLPALFRFPASGYIWLGTGTNKTPVKVIDQKDIQLYDVNVGNFAYFLQDPTPTLEFNPNATFATGPTISYNYYKYATALADGDDTFEMSDPMFAVFYALSELKKEEGDTSALSLATQKLEGMKTRNMMGAWHQQDTLINRIGGGFGR